MHISAVFILLVQVVLILGLSRFMGTLASRVRQPKVVGEMLAGIMLGPSFFGLLAPHIAGSIFSPQSVVLLNALAQLGVIIFLFLIGLELDPALLRKRGHAAVVISHVSIIAPFLLGAAATLVLYPRVFNHTPQMRFTAVALFMGAAMSITAFPVLARVLTERDLQKTKVGAVAITCAAVDDVSAWCMLAFVVAIGRAEGLSHGLITAGLSLAYVLLMFFVVRPLLRRLDTLYERQGSSAQAVFAIVLVLMLLSAAATECIGIHALFGAFFMGAIMPKNARFVRTITGRLEDFTVIFLLPIFFAYAGLQTQIGLLNSVSLWGLTGLIILVACAGKFGGSAVAARITGLPWRESAAIGILMNTRGLVELVILTIGLQLGIITPVVFAMMVIMALVTTALTTPILHWVYPERLFKTQMVEESTTGFGVLIPLARPDSALNLIRLAAAMCKGQATSKIFGITLIRPNRDESLGVRLLHDDRRDQALQSLQNAARELGVSAELSSFVSRDIPADIAHIARAKRANLILMGFHKALFGKTILGGTVHRVLTAADTDVAIFVDRGIGSTINILVPYQGSAHDRLAVALAARMGGTPGVTVTILHVVAAGKSKPDATSMRRQSFPDSVEVWVVEDASPVDAVLRQSGDFNLLIVGLSEEWGLASHLFGRRAERLAHEWHGSLLLVRKHQSPVQVQEPSLAPAPVSAAVSDDIHGVP